MRGAPKGSYAWDMGSNKLNIASPKDVPEDPVIGKHMASLGATFKSHQTNASSPSDTLHEYEHSDPVAAGRSLVAHLEGKGWHHRTDAREFEPGGWESGSHSSGGFSAEFKHPKTLRSREVRILPPPKPKGKRKVAKAISLGARFLGISE